MTVTLSRFLWVCFGILCFLTLISCTGGKSATLKRQPSTALTGECPVEISQARLERVNSANPFQVLTDTSATVGEPVRWRLAFVGGCGPDFELSRPGGQEPPVKIKTREFLFNLTYANAQSNRVEELNLVDTKNPLQPVVVSSSPFNVVAAEPAGVFGCTVNVDRPSIVAQADSMGKIIGSPPGFMFGVSITSSSASGSVLVPGVVRRFQVLSSTLLDVMHPANRIPTPAGAQHALFAAISRLGTHEFTISAVHPTDTSKTAVCSASVTVNRAEVPPPPPAACSLSATPTSVLKGQEVTVRLTATGAVAQAMIDGQNIALNSSGVGTFVVKTDAESAGTKTSMGMVNGSGGSSGCQVSYVVREPEIKEVIVSLWVDGNSSIEITPDQIQVRTWRYYPPGNLQILVVDETGAQRIDYRNVNIFPWTENNRYTQSPVRHLEPMWMGDYGSRHHRDITFTYPGEFGKYLVGTASPVKYHSGDFANLQGWIKSSTNRALQDLTSSSTRLFFKAIDGEPGAAYHQVKMCRAGWQCRF